MNPESNVQSDVIFHRIIVPHDLSGRCDKAFQLAGTMAHPLRSEVVVIHVIDPTERREGENAARDRLRILQIAARRLLPEEVKVDIRILSGDPQGVILAEVQKIGADLLIVTVHPHTGAGYPFRGWETEHLQRKVSCPVLTVPVLEDERPEIRKLQTHSLKQYCDVSRKLSRTGSHRPVYLGYSHLPSSPTGVCD